MAVNEDIQAKLEEALNNQDFDLKDIKREDRDEQKRDTQE
jgi:hypothetical protein